MAAKKKSASKKTAAALKRPPQAAAKAKPGKQPVPTKAKMAATKVANSAKPKSAKAAAGGGSTVKNTLDGYFEKAGGWQEEAMRKIHDIVVDTAEGVEHGIKWAQPVY